jgi:hypothetical protein
MLRPTPRARIQLLYTVQFQEDLYMPRTGSSISRRGRSSSGMSSSSRSGSSRSSSRGRSSRGRSSRGRSSGSSFLGISGLPSWMPVTLGIVGLCGAVYGLMQITSVRSFMSPVIDDVGEFFGLTSVEGIDSSNITHDRTYSSVLDNG